MWTHVDALLTEYHALFERSADESEPYVHKYAARKLLEAWLQAPLVASQSLPRERDASAAGSALPAWTTSEDVAVCKAVCLQKLGVNHMVTEEHGEAETPLVDAVLALRVALCREDARTHLRSHWVTCVHAVLEGCNYLALLLSGWDKHPRALRFLRVGKDTYRTALRQVQSEDAPRLRRVDALYTHTLYYFAQVYAHLGCAAASARYVDATLRRQLAEQEAHDGVAPIDEEDRASLDRCEWVRNALRLCELHATKRRYHAACAAAAAAEIMLANVVAERHAAETATCTGVGKLAWGKLSDSLQQLSAEAALAWARVYTHVLREAYETAVNGGVTPAARGDVEDVEDDGDMFSTLPTMKVKSRPPARIVGEGADCIDVEASDHEGDDTLMHATAHGGADAVSPPRMMTLPFADFLRAHAPAWASAASAVVPLPAGAPCTALHVAAAATVAQYHGPACIALGDVSLPAPGHVVSGLSDVPTPAAVTSFEAARDVFKAANAAFTRAMQYYVLDGHVSDHVAALQACSKCYKYLAYFEQDAKRAGAMHARRVEMLAPLLSVLNPAVFIHTFKEVSLELAVTCQEAFELRLARIEARVAREGGSMKKAEADAANELLDRSVDNYVLFLRCYSDSKLAGAPISRDNGSMDPLAGATTLDDASAPAYVTAHFSIARMLYKRLPVELEAHVRDLKLALARFQWVVARGRTILPQQDMLITELRMAAEMVSLLPSKIDAVHFRGMAAGAAAARVR